MSFFKYDQRNEFLCKEASRTIPGWNDLDNNLMFRDLFIQVFSNEHISNIDLAYKIDFPQRLS